jgi:hypothetical protein
MTVSPWTPWHKVVTLREDVRSGELSLAIFAADLYDVVMGTARPVYQKPEEFFALTYPTVALRDLARDVVQRLAGKNAKAVRQLELTYGGGKTHTLITLYHLAHDPKNLPTKLPTVKEFTNHIGVPLPQTRIAVLAFDKLDVEKGMEITGPKGERRWLKQPWSVFAWQIAGAEGLRLLHPDGKDEERASAPAENLMSALLAIPERQGLATLILLDEVLMYARAKVGLDTGWRDTLINFFQYLTQAAVKAPRCAVVASLLATDTSKYDTLGREIIGDIYAIFKRESEQSVQPVGKEDAAEVLRRRFFTPESIRDRNAFRPHVVAATEGIVKLDEQSARDRANLEKQLLQSYPFHPALTDIFYTRWTNLESFQRTRGVLRTFALALRDAERWDAAPLVGVNVFLNRPDEPSLAEAARELATVAATEEYEGRRHAWPQILEDELRKAREIQREQSGLHQREVEQAVFATFLHSQPIGQKASTRDLLLLLGPTRPDRIDLEKALLEWVRTSWFLDESTLGEGQIGALGRGELPRYWRLGSKPNLRQMHHDARDNIPAEVIEEQLTGEIGKLADLKAGVAAAGVKMHLLPNTPNDVQDDGEFHFAVLAPSAASSPGRASPEATRYLTETTSAARPRVNKNAIILVVPSHDGVSAARNAIRDHLAWKAVQAQITGQHDDPIRSATLNAELNASRQRIPEAIRQAYCLVVALDDKGAVEVFKVTPGNSSLFAAIKDDARSRIVEEAVDAGALLPGGPYDLWRAGEPTRRVKDLVGAFAANPHLPRMLNSHAALETLVAGCREGALILQVPRPDRTYRTFWREEVDATALSEPALEAALPEHAILASLSSHLLVPQALPGLWQSPQFTFGALVTYFAGGHAVQVNRGSYTEPVIIPRADRETLSLAVNAAVKGGHVWLRAGPASLYAEDIPAGVLTDAAQMQAPPQPITATQVLAPNLPDAWSNGDETNARAIADALAAQAGQPLPWKVVRDALDGAFTARYLERTADSGAWPCDAGGASAVRVRVPAGVKPDPDGGRSRPAPLPRAGVYVAESSLSIGEVQNLADQISELQKTATRSKFELNVHVRVELAGTGAIADAELDQLNQTLRAVSPKLTVNRDATSGSNQ